MSSPAALLELAEELKLKQGASRRAAISRAYYAAFHALQAAVAPMMKESDIGRNGCAKHGSVLKALRTWSRDHPDRKARMAHGADATKAYNLLVACLEHREKADYQMGEQGESRAQDAVATIGRARRIIEFAKKAA